MPDSGGGSNSKTGQQVTSNNPPDYLLPGLKTGANAATNLWNTGALQQANVPYSGPTVATPSPATQQSWGGITDLATNGNSATNAGQSYITGILGGDTSGIQPLINNTRNAVNSTYEGAGRYGSGSHDAAVANGVGTVIANQMSGAAQLAPQYAATQLANQQALNGVGGQQQAQQQAQMDAAQQLYYQKANQAPNALSQYLNLLQGMNTGGTASTATYGGQGAGGSALSTGLGVGTSLLGSYLGSGGTFGL